MEWPNRIQSCASVGENLELGGMLSSAIKKQIGVKSKVIDINQYEDRKSTRLNYSHDQISYAVFCVKKKKNQNRNTA